MRSGGDATDVIIGGKSVGVLTDRLVLQFIESRYI